MQHDLQTATTSPRHRILAADDDPIMREMITARLGIDIDVTCAENGEAAWHKLREEKFDLAIIDLGMPKLDGFGLIQYLRQTPRTVDLPIIVATSRGDQEAIERAFDAGASGFVTKPINWSLFKYNVQFVLKNGQTEKLLRATTAANELASRSKDRLLELLASTTLASPEPADASKPVQNAKISNAVSDVIYLAKLLSNDRQATAEEAGVNEIIRQIVASLQSLAKEKSVKLVGRQSLANISISIETPVFIDILTRLVRIGIDASPPGGTVELNLGGQRDGSLVISVRDNGPLKSQAETDAKLDVLIKNDVSARKTGEIPDLDLPIVKRGIELHGGRALFQNKPGEGNVAALWLPATRVKIEQLEQSA